MGSEALQDLVGRCLPQSPQDIGEQHRESGEDLRRQEARPKFRIVLAPRGRSSWGTGRAQRQVEATRENRILSHERTQDRNMV